MEFPAYALALVLHMLEVITGRLQIGCHSILTEPEVDLNYQQTCDS